MPATMLRAKLAGLAALAMALPATAVAQDIDRITGMTTPGGGFRAPEGVKVVSPGALIFASFDRNGDGRISVAEIEAGAEVAFAAADRNGDGAVTGFEQTDWANAMGSSSDLIANAMTFDIDLDRSVTRAEFTAGLKRIAAQIQPNAELTFADLLLPLQRPSDQAGPGPGGGFGGLPRGAPPNSRN
jgi:hypothetical protein